MIENVGGVQYVVEANTAQLLKAEHDMLRSVDKMDKSLKGIGGASKHINVVADSVKDLGVEAEKSGFKLSRMQTAILSVATLATARSIATMADDYRAMGERVLGATESVEEFNMVQARLLDSANKTFRPLEEAQELFISTSGNIRDYGYSLDEALDITDSMSYGFVRNAASADKAKSAIRAYDASLSTGKVNAMQWLSISGAIDTLAIDMGKQMGLTAREVDALGHSGQISAQMLNDALLAAFKANKDGADAMKNTIADAMVSVRNNISVYVGELNKAHGVTDIIAKSIIYLSENVDVLAKILLSAGSGAMALYISKVGMMTVAKMKDALATRASIVEEIRLAQANVEATKAEVARTAAIVAKGGSQAKATAAVTAHAFAVANLSKVQSASIGVMRTFMAALGGPAGIIGLLATGATAIAMFTSSASDAGIEIKSLSSSVGQLVEEFNKLSDAQMASEIVRYSKEQKQATKEVADEYKELIKLIVKTSAESIKSGMIGSQSMRDYIEEAFDSARQSGESYLNVVKRIAVEMGVTPDVLDSWIEQNAVLDKTHSNLNHVDSVLKLVTKSQRELAEQANRTSEELRKQAEINKTAGDEIQKFADNMQRSRESAEDQGSAVKQAERAIAKYKATTTEVDETLIESIRTNAIYIDGQKKSASATNSNAQMIANLNEELRLATLSGKDLAIARAENQLNAFATQQEIQAVRELTSVIYDLQEAKKFGDTKEDQDKYIEGDVGNLTGGAFDDQVARYEREAELEQEKYQAQLDRLRQARELGLQTESEFNDKEYDLMVKHNARMGRIEQAKQQVTIQAYKGAADAVTDVLMSSNDENSRIYKAAFAISKGFAIAEATVKAHAAISSAWASAPFPENIAAVAATTPQVMGVVSAIQGVSYGGGRQYGGYTSPDKYYRINETGKPEIFNDRSGNQYMLPTNGGSITPAHKIGSDGAESKQGGGIVIHQTIQIESGADVSEEMIAKLQMGLREEMKSISEQITIKTMTEQQMSGGILRG